MAKTDTFKCSVITPERAVLECDANFVAFPAHDGEMGVLFNRAPLVCKLGIGPLRVESTGAKHVLLIDGGFAEVVDNRVTILTEQAVKPDQIDRAAAQQSLDEAREMKITDDASYIARDNAFKRARAKLKLARS
jgi:F-type H+-transporting ATPase subunit epsilon